VYHQRVLFSERGSPCVAQEVLELKILFSQLSVSTAGTTEKSHQRVLDTLRKLALFR
jgi:hypothetical protein